jgi:DNA-binding response OmpR family regulator
MDVHVAVLVLDGEGGTETGDLLRREGYAVSEFSDLEPLLGHARTVDVDLVLMLGAASAEEALASVTAEAIRAISEVGLPLLVVAPVADEAFVIRALRLGADACVCAPLGNAELLARLEAQVRRHWHWGAARRVREPEEIVIDAISCAAIVAGREVRLTPTEYRLLSRLAESEGDVVPADELCSHVWGLDSSASPSSLRLYISHLRRKLESDPHKPRFIRTKWGVGYYLQGREAEA